MVAPSKPTDSTEKHSSRCNSRLVFHNMFSLMAVVNDFLSQAPIRKSNFNCCAVDEPHVTRKFWLSGECSICKKPSMLLHVSLGQVTENKVLRPSVEVLQPLLEQCEWRKGLHAKQCLHVLPLAHCNKTSRDYATTVIPGASYLLRDVGVFFHPNFTRMCSVAVFLHTNLARRVSFVRVSKVS